MQFAFQQRARIRAFGVIDVFVLGAVDQLNVAGSTHAVVGFQLKWSGAVDRHPGHAHDLPDIDHHFGIANKEQIHVRIDVNRSDGKPPIDTWFLQHRADFGLGRWCQLIERNRLECLLASLFGASSCGHLSHAVCAIGEREQQGECQYPQLDGRQENNGSSDHLFSSSNKSVSGN